MTVLDLSVILCFAAMVFALAGLLVLNRAEADLKKACDIRKKAREELNDAKLLWNTMISETPTYKVSEYVVPPSTQTKEIVN